MKKIKVKLQQCGFPSNTYRIEQITNAISVETTGRARVQVGEYLTPEQAEDLCRNRKYEVVVNAIEND